MIVILGPTATGKTTIATHLAADIHGEIISADSRQVFSGMDIGTGKDLSEYVVNGVEIPYHLIDIAQPGMEYSVFDFQTDFYKAYDQIITNGNIPILCGGTGLYLESVICAYPMAKVPVNEELRASFVNKSLEQLSEMLANMKNLHNQTDTEDRDRVIRAIEIETYSRENADEIEKSRRIIEPMTVFGVDFDREIVRQRITKRLKERLENGMIDEVQRIFESGVSHERLQRYGLEYRFVSLFLDKKIDYNTMFKELNIAIHQFSKRQKTWFRRMESKGIVIHWIDGSENIVNILKIIQDVSNV